MIRNITSGSNIAAANASHYAAPSIRAVRVGIECGFAYSTVIEGAPEYDYGDF